MFRADSALLVLSSFKNTVKGTAIFWNDSLRTVGMIDGIVNHNNIEFSVSIPAFSFSIDGEGSVSGNKLTGEFRKWRTEQDEFEMPHVLYGGGGNFILEKRPS